MKIVLVLAIVAAGALNKMSGGKLLPRPTEVKFPAQRSSPCRDLHGAVLYAHAR